MKSILRTVLCGICCIALMDLQAQVSLPYYSGFDNAAERSGWTIYRLGESAINGWSISNAGGFSPPSCISHDYSPSSGVTLVDDWYVSPGFNIPSGGTLDSVRYAFSGFSVPTTGDTIGVYLILGDQNPGIASEIIELEEFRDGEYQADNTYRLLSGIDLPATNKMAFIGIRYRNAQASSRWLHARFDNIAVSESTTAVIKPGTVHLLQIFPNPAADDVTITHKEAGGVVRIYSHTGLLIHQCELAPGQTSTRLSIDQLPQGNYQFIVEQKNSLYTTTVLKM